MIDIAFAPPGLPTSGALALLVGEGARPAGVWAEADAATSGAVARGFEAAGFTGKKGQTCVLPGPGAGLSRIVAVGLGKPDAHTERDVEEAEPRVVAEPTASGARISHGPNTSCLQRFLHAQPPKPYS